MNSFAFHVNFRVPNIFYNIIYLDIHDRIYFQIRSMVRQNSHLVPPRASLSNSSDNKTLSSIAVVKEEHRNRDSISTNDSEQIDETRTTRVPSIAELVQWD